MLGLPCKTEININVDKDVVFKRFNFDKKQADAFDADISSICIVNEISEISIGISKGEQVSSIHILHIVLNKKDYNDANIIRLFKLINNKMLLALQYNDEIQIVAYHTKLFKSIWHAESNAVIKLTGLNLDTVYDNLIMQIGNFELEQGNTLEEQIVTNEEKAKIQKEIARLEKLARAEKQPKKKFELVQMIKTLQKDSGVYNDR